MSNHRPTGTPPGINPAAPASANGQVPWPVEALRAAVFPYRAGLGIEILPEIDSSNSELMRRARAGRREPLLLVAEHQSAGRGRLGRVWVSGPDAGSPSSLTFSLGLPFAPADWSGFSLAVGVSLAESLDPRIQLKWPNDLWLSDRKLAGILIETASFGDGGGGQRYAVIGIGVNIVAPEPAGLSTPPAGLRELIAGVAAADVLLRIAPPLLQAVNTFETLGFASFQARFKARDALAGRPVVLSDGTTGTAQGVDERGALLVHTARGMNSVTSSEVSVRARH